MTNLVDRIVASDSPILIATHERQVKQLEEPRLLLEAKIEKCRTFDTSIEKINRTTLEFLENPLKYWVSSDLEGKRLVLKATFSRPLAYHRTEW